MIAQFTGRKQGAIVQGQDKPGKGKPRASTVEASLARLVDSLPFPSFDTCEKLWFQLGVHDGDVCPTYFHWVNRIQFARIPPLVIHYKNIMACAAELSRWSMPRRTDLHNRPGDGWASRPHRNITSIPAIRNPPRNEKSVLVL